MRTIPRFYAEEGAIETGAELEGVSLQTLGACDTIHVRTRNSNYEIFLLDPESGRAMLQGGPYFAEPVEATVSGSTIGSYMLKDGWIGLELRMEIYVHGQCIVTSPVQELRVARVGAETENASWDQSAAVAKIDQ